MIVLIGESASGKSSIERELVNSYGYNRIISYTTRPPREGEENGVDYHFVSNDQFVELFKQGFFAETTHYNGNGYGCAVNDCTDDKVIVVDPNGLKQLKSNPNLNIKSFYIWVDRRSRLIKMLQRGDDIENAYRRSIYDEGKFSDVLPEVSYVADNENYKFSIPKMANKIHCIACNLSSEIID